ncbi:gamma-aminobutyric acid type B receptor subunit 1-like [Ptychodera flava]|uniref:gamma-aminobutyric acid type B receptor subunit 1-like n=1 Tax=Ptychodera flava TaxID=63121 RepID=UPI003969E458
MVLIKFAACSCVPLLLIIETLPITPTLQIGSDDRTALNLLGLFPVNTHSWAGGESTLPATELAIAHVNERHDLLPGYKLTMTWGDSKCEEGEAVDAVYRLLYREPTKIIVFGPGCSPCCQAVAGSIRHWGLLQISYGCSVPSLSDKTQYPTFTRIRPPDTSQNIARVSLLQYFDWNKVAILHENLDLFTETLSDMSHMMNERGMKVVSSEPIHDDPRQPLEKIKNKGARIIIAFFYTPLALRVFCEAYKLHMIGSKYAWFIQGWYEDTWIDDTWRDGVVDCTKEQIAESIEGAFSVFTFDINPVRNEPGISGMTPNEYLDLYDEYVNYTTESLTGYKLSGAAYDAVWAIALALNDTKNKLEAVEGDMRLENFTYGDQEFGDMLMDSMSSVEFDGVYGKIKFTETGDVLTDFKLQQYQGGVNVNIGIFRTATEELDFHPDVPIIWKGDGPPVAELTTNYVIQKVPVYLYSIMSLLASLGILCSVVFLSLNIKFRHKRIIKMSSPNINNIILCGCILTYMSVLSADIEDSSIDALSSWKASIYVLLLGFSTAYGALFSKTWRVHVIFTNVKLRRKVVKDGQLVALVLIFIAIDIITIVFWETLDPVRVVVTDLNRLPEEIGDRIYIYQFESCESTYMSYWLGVIYSTKALMLLFGVFLAWETRKVSITVLNDSRHIGMCIYNVVILSSVGAPVAYVLRYQTDIAYVIKSVFVILGTTVTQCLVVLPKIMAYRAGEDVAMGTNSIRPGMTQTEHNHWPDTCDDDIGAGPSRLRVDRNMAVSVGVQVQL